MADDPRFETGNGIGWNKSAHLGSESSRVRLRAEPRNHVDTRAIVRLVNAAAEVSGRILDLSSGGCRIQTDERFQVGIYRRVETEFRLEGLPFRLAGVTQAIYDPFNVGIRFLDVSERKREQLLQLIEEIQEHTQFAEPATQE